MKKIVVLLKKIIDILKKSTQSDDPISNADRLRSTGMSIGTNVHIYSSNIDTTYPKAIIIGNNVTITNATILSHDASTKKYIGATKLRAVHIGDNCFVGYGSIILPGVTVGNNVVIGAGSVVRSDIPNDSVVFGNPACVVCKTSEYMQKNMAKLEVSGIINKADITRDMIKDTIYIE